MHFHALNWHLLPCNDELTRLWLFTSVAESIPSYSGQRIYMQNCSTDDVGFQIVKDLQMSAAMKAKWLNTNLCRREANLLCDPSTKVCRCIKFGGTASVWDRVRIKCIGPIGSKCRTFTKLYPAMKHRYIHKPECTSGASCEDFIYDTEETCKCDEGFKAQKSKCQKTTRSNGINVFRPHRRFCFFCVAVLVNVLCRSCFKS